MVFRPQKPEDTSRLDNSSACGAVKNHPMVHYSGSTFKDNEKENTNREITSSVRECKFCQQTIELQKNKPPLNYLEGTIHKCAGRERQY